MKGFRKVFTGRKKKCPPSGEEKMDISMGLLANETSIGMPTPAGSADRSIGSTANNQLTLDIRREVAPQAAADLNKDQRRGVETTTYTREGATAASRALMPEECKATPETTRATNDEAVPRAKLSVTELIGMEAVEEYTLTNGSANYDAEVSDGVPTLIDTAGRLPDRFPASRKSSMGSTMSDASGHAFDDAPHIIRSYDSVPLLEQTKLPRGGISMETQAVGRVQFGIPPETIKDSMRLGLAVPAVYIVPVERFCREMGPALGVNLAEFEFPAYFNFFVYKKRCTLVVDSEDAERNIRRVFSETLLGPAQFRRGDDSIQYEEEDFAPDFPREMIPNFNKELKHFRIMPDGKELVLETLLNFRHFELPDEIGVHENLGVPPPFEEENLYRASSDPLDVGNLDDFDVDGSKREEEVPENRENVAQVSWTYSQAKWIGDVSTVWPPNATEEDIRERKCKRAEIFKMPGGTEYILHDVDENNIIVGKARFSGHMKVSESLSVDGFGGKSILDQVEPASENGEDPDEDYDSDSSEVIDSFLEKNVLPPTFHPPSFGVTVLGNSHGFDKVGSTSGYVLWVNGRGVMIDPPPYSSATLEREGIRPRTIVGIILTHCHADHDAGAFQKVLTGSPVVVITTPTIYKSFIRKYAALSALSPALLRHSHRHKPAIIGKPLRFQGATFHFTYTLHTIPCVGFKVEWRGRSMVFTGDHFNSPPAIDKLQESGVLSRARADDLRNLPLQETDLLLHEAGAPPIHTPLDVLLALPQRVKKRMYVVHTSALPEDCELRVAPTGTAGTIRLDKLDKATTPIERSMALAKQRSFRGDPSLSLEDDGLFSSPWSSASNEYGAINEDAESQGSDPRMMTSFSNLAAASSKSKAARSNSLLGQDSNAPPLVSLRPASSTDAWFILNLLSAVPFLTSLSYASTMEVLETARVDAYCKDDVIVTSARRNDVLCVVWEGTCVERDKTAVKTRPGGGRISAPLIAIRDFDSKGKMGAVWYAGDWTGPISLQPEKRLSGDSALVDTHDVVAMSSEGVKVITVEFSNLHAILKTGSALYRKYLERKNQKTMVSTAPALDASKPLTTQELLAEAIRTLNVLELLDCNSALRKLSAVQKRHLESLAEGPISFQPGERLWRAGAPVDKAFIVVSGTASFVPRRRNAGSVGLPASGTKVVPTLAKPSRVSGEVLDTTVFNADDRAKFVNLSLGESMRLDAITAIRELGKGNPLPDDSKRDEVGSFSLTPSGDAIPLDAVFARSRSTPEDNSPISDAHDYVKLSRGLQKRADLLNKSEGSNSPDILSLDGHDHSIDLDGSNQIENVFLDLESDLGKIVDDKDRRLSLARRRSSRARFANKVLGRLYSRRAFTGGLVFSRGHFLGDVSKMVAGLLSRDFDPTDSSHVDENPEDDSTGPKYGFGEKTEGGLDRASSSHHGSVSDVVIHEQSGNEHAVHSSTLTAGKEGCIVLVIPKASLIPFLDEYPGLLLSLLGTQVVV